MSFEDVRILASSAIAAGDWLHDEWVVMEMLRTCSRLMGLVERAARSVCDCAKQRVSFGQPLSSRNVGLHVILAGCRSIDEVLQVYGGIGFTQDMPIESMWLHIRQQRSGATKHP